MRYLTFLLACIFPLFVEAGTYQLNEYYNGGGTFVDCQAYQYQIDVVPVGPLPDGGSITLAEVGGANGTNLPATAWGTKSTAPYIVQGLGPYSVTINPGVPTATTPTVYNVGVTTSWGGQTAQVQFGDTFTQNKVTSTTYVGGKQQVTILHRTVYILPAKFDTGKWNIELNTRTDKILGKSYQVKWGTELKGMEYDFTATNPTTPASFFSEYDHELAEGDPTTMPTTVFRRMAGGTWQTIWTGSIALGTTQIINDFPEEPIPGSTPDTGNTPPGTATVQNPNGTGTGAITDTSGNGLTTSTSGTAGATGSGTTGGTGTSGGGGTGGLTEPDVEQAVRAGSKEAANDSTQSDVPLPTLDTTGTGIGTTPFDKATAQAAFDTSVANHQTAMSALDSATTGVGQHMTSVALPGAPGTDALEWSATLPVIGAININLAPYEASIGILRALLLAFLTIQFFLLNIKVTKWAFAS